MIALLLNVFVCKDPHHRGQYEGAGCSAPANPFTATQKEKKHG